MAWLNSVTELPHWDGAPCECGYRDRSFLSPSPTLHFLPLSHYITEKRMLPFEFGGGRGGGELM